MGFWISRKPFQICYTTTKVNLPPTFFYKSESSKLKEGKKYQLSHSSLANKPHRCWSQKDTSSIICWSRGMNNDALSSPVFGGASSYSGFLSAEL